MVNWMGLPGIGAKKIAEKLIAQQHCLRCSSVPITINLMSTPQKQGEVLGASTELPATGAKTLWTLSAIALLLAGLNLMVIGFTIRKRYV